MPNVVVWSAQLSTVNKRPRRRNIHGAGLFTLCNSLLSMILTLESRDTAQKILFQGFLFSSHSAHLAPVFRKPPALAHCFSIGSTGRESSPLPNGCQDSRTVQLAHTSIPVCSSSRAPVQQFCKLIPTCLSQRKTKRKFSSCCWIYRYEERTCAIGFFGLFAEEWVKVYALEALMIEITTWVERGV